MPAAQIRTDRRWDEVLEEHRDAIAGFLEVASRLDDGAWGEPWAPDKWTRGQVAQHLVLVYEALLKEVRTGERMTTRMPRWRQNMLRWIVLPHILFHRSFPGRPRSPREARPAEPLPPCAEVLRRLRELGERFETEVTQARRNGGGGLTHPYFGTIEPVRGMRFIAVHIEHHTRQIATRS